MNRQLAETLYTKYYQELYLYVFSMCRRSALTEDILQETFLKALIALKDSHTNMRAWLYTVARNLCLNYLQKERRTETLDGEGRREQEDPADAGGPLAQLIAREEKCRLWEALLSLESPKREILILQYFGGFRQKEIAALLHLTQENVRVQSCRAKRQLREKLEQEDGPTAGCRQMEKG